MCHVQCVAAPAGAYGATQEGERTGRPRKGKRHRKPTILEKQHSHIPEKTRASSEFRGSTSPERQAETEQTVLPELHLLIHLRGLNISRSILTNEENQTHVINWTATLRPTKDSSHVTQLWGNNSVQDNSSTLKTVCCNILTTVIRIISILY